MGKRKEVLETKTFQYIAIGDGKKRTFYNEDGLTEYPGNIIRNPRTMSYTNLYINGVLQPQNHYTIRHGVLHLKTIDVPPEGAPIILHFIKIFLKTKRKIRRRKRTFLTYESEEE